MKVEIARLDMEPIQMLESKKRFWKTIDYLLVLI